LIGADGLNSFGGLGLATQSHRRLGKYTYGKPKMYACTPSV